MHADVYGPDREGEVLKRLTLPVGPIGTYWLRRLTSSAETLRASGSAIIPADAAGTRVCGVDATAFRGWRAPLGGGTSGDDCAFLSLPSGPGRDAVGSEPDRDGGLGSGPRTAPARLHGLAGGSGGGDGRVRIDGDSGSSAAARGDGVLVVVQVRRAAGTGGPGHGVGVTYVRISASSSRC